MSCFRTSCASKTEQLQTARGSCHTAHSCYPRNYVAFSCSSLIATPDNHMMTSADSFQGYPFPRSLAASVIVWPNRLAPSYCFAGDVIHTTATFVEGSQPVFSLVKAPEDWCSPLLTSITSTALPQERRRPA